MYLYNYYFTIGINERQKGLCKAIILADYEAEIKAILDVAYRLYGGDFQEDLGNIREEFEKGQTRERKDDRAKEKLSDLYNTDTEELEAVAIYKTQNEADFDNETLRQNNEPQRWIPSKSNCPACERTWK